MSNLPNNIDQPRKGTVVSGEIIHYGVYGIKCDSCDYSDMSVEYKDYPKYVDKPCPVCGEPLLTQSQLQETNAAINAAEQLNAMDDGQLKLIEKELNNMSDEEKAALIQSLPSWMLDAMPELKI